MQKELVTEARNPASVDLDRLSTIDFVRLVNSEDVTLAKAVADQAREIAMAIDLIVIAWQTAGVSSTWALAHQDVSVCWTHLNARRPLVLIQSR